MRERLQRMQRDAVRPTPKRAPDVVGDVVRSPGKPLDSANRGFMESRFGHDFGRVRIHDDATARASLDAVDAHAYAVGSHVVLGNQDRHTLAHELAHVVQQRGASTGGTVDVGDRDDAAEHEASWAADQVMSLSAGAQPMLSALSAAQSVQRQPKQDPRGPNEDMIVNHARHRLPVLRQYVKEYGVRKVRRGDVDTEVGTMLEKRAAMDIQGSDPLPEPRLEAERQMMNHANTRPVSIDVTEQQITLRVKFQVRFEEGKNESKFGDLKSSIQKGIDTIWNQDLKSGVFGGRKFIVKPEITRVGATAARDRSAWLITVRPSDTAPVSYPGCKLDQPDPGAPTSVTDPNCDGGIMSIPPSHIARPEILGHEMLHLFGFVDRYMQLTKNVDGKTQTTLNATRATGGRPDPLASAKGPVLVEDLSLLFNNLGVYDAETTRGLDALHQLEREGMTYADVTAEIARDEEIVRTGRDPDSPAPPKKSFIKKIEDSVDELPI